MSAMYPLDKDRRAKRASVGAGPDGVVRIYLCLRRFLGQIDRHFIKVPLTPTPGDIT